MPVPRWDRPSSGSDSPGGGDDARQRMEPDLFSPYRPQWDRLPRAARDQSPRAEEIRENGEGTGWPANKPKTPEIPRTPEQRIKDLESEVKSLKSENARLTGSYESSLRELQRKDNELSHAKSELANAKSDSARLIDTNSRLVRDNMELRTKTDASSLLDQREKSPATQADEVEKKPHRKNWFPTDKVGSFGGAVAGAAGTYAVMVGRVGSKEEAFGVACAGAGVATLALGREVADKINDWRDKRAEKKNADR